MKKALLTITAITFLFALKAQNVGIGETSPASKFSVKGNLSVGNVYSGTAAPANGAIIEGNVGIGTSSPDGNTVLDIASSNKGIRIPNVALTAPNSPISGAKPDGLLVYNTSVSGSYATPGIYMWSATSSDWVRIITNTTLSSSLQPLTNTVNGGLTTFSYNGSTATSIAIATDGITNAMLQDNVITTNEIAAATITSADMGPNSIDLSSGVVTNILPINRGGTNTNTLGSGGSVAYSNGTSYAFTPVGTSGQVLLSGGTGAPTWSSPNAALTKTDITTGTTGVSITNGTGQVVGGSNVAINVATNSSTSPGLVASGAGQATKVWGTDASGNPAWVEAGTVIDVQNGLNVNTTAPNASASNPYIELGGPLVRNTTITGAAFNYTHNLSGTGDFEVQENGASALVVRGNEAAITDGFVGVNTNAPSLGRLHVVEATDDAVAGVYVTESGIGQAVNINEAGNGTALLITAADAGTAINAGSTGAVTANATGYLLSDTRTSSTASITKTGLDVQSTGTWNGAGATNTGLNVNVSGGTTNYAALFSGGNVGIGTTTPNSALTVRTGVATANARVASLANAIADPLFELAVSRGATTNAVGDITTQIGQAYNGSTITEGIRFIRGTTATDGAMAFVTNNGTERMRITSTGAIAVNGATNYGTSGQVLMSNGNASPSWANPGSTLTAGQGIGIATNTISVNNGVSGWVQVGTATNLPTAKTDFIYNNGNVGIGDFSAPGSTTARLNISVAADQNNNPANNGIYVYNPNNAGDNDDAIITARVGGSAAGDPMVSFDINGVAGWSMGIDNSDADKFKIGSNWDDPSTTPRMTIQYSDGNVGIGTTSPAFKLHVPSGNIGTDYINTTDNVVGSGVSGIMVKAGDNYHRTANAAAVLSFLGVTAPTGDNLGNHVATTTLNMNGNVMTNFRRIEPWGIGGNSGEGTNAYAIFQEGGAWSFPYPDLRIAYHTGIKLGANASYQGIRFYTDYDMVTQVMSVNNANDPLGGGNVYVNNNLQAGASLRAPIFYDANNTGYYLDPDANSQTSSIYNNNWFRAQGQSGFYFQDYGGGWQMVDATWIRAYNSKPILATGGLAGYGNGVFGTPFNGNPRIYANYDNVSAGGIAISDDGGFYDFNDGWIQSRFSNGQDMRSNSTTWNTIFTMGNQDNSGVNDKLVATRTDNWGLIGGSGNAWYRGYSYGWITSSMREKKRDITPIEGDLAALVMADIDKLKPSFYKYNGETDEYNESTPYKYRPNYHIGLILDESPDYLQDEQFSGIDNYSAATLGLLGAKVNHQEIKKLKQNVQDFGSVPVTSTTVNVQFSQDFSVAIAGQALPVVTVNANTEGIVANVVEKTSNGFKVVVNKTVPGLILDYIAIGKTNKANDAADIESKISPEIMNGIRIPESIKEEQHKRAVLRVKAQEEAEKQAKIDGERIHQERLKEIGIQKGDPAKESSRKNDKINE